MCHLHVVVGEPCYDEKKFHSADSSALHGADISLELLHMLSIVLFGIATLPGPDEDNHTSDTSNRRLPVWKLMRKNKLSLSESCNPIRPYPRARFPGSRVQGKGMGFKSTFQKD